MKGIWIWVMLWAFPIWAHEFPLNFTREEEELLEWVGKEKYIRARELAEKILDKNPRSIAANYGESMAYYQKEANLARALYYVLKAQALIEEKYGKPPELENAKFWHRKILLLKIDIYGEIDQREKELEAIDEYNGYYDPDLEVQKMWALLKLRRFDEAEAIGKKGIYSDDDYERIVAYNSLIALYDQKRDRIQSYKWGKRALAKLPEASCVIAGNTALAAFQNAKFDEIEELIQLAENAPVQDCSSNPKDVLVAYYILTGAFQKAISTLKELQNEPMSARMGIQFRMHNKTFLVELLYALGQFEEAQVRFKDVMDHPDRVGMTNSSKEGVQLCYTIFEQAIRLGALEVWKEKWSVRHWRDRAKLLKEMPKLKLGFWERRRMIIYLSHQEDLVKTIIKPYYLEIYPWLTGVLGEVLGTGFVRKLVEETRMEDVPLVGSYYDALIAQSYWYDRNAEEALEWSLKALKGLPLAERLLRWKIQAILGWAYEQEGALQKSVEAHHEVLMHFSSVYRHLGMAIPVQIQISGGERAREAGQRLSQSPRFEILPQSPLVLDIRESKEGLTLCLLGAQGFRYRCIESWKDEKGKKWDLNSEEEWVNLLDRFHQKVFEPKVSLTQRDMRSLDGSPVQIDSDRALEDLLKNGQF